jgi:hypothetical protein
VAEYYSYKSQVPLKSGEKLGYTAGRGYYAIAAPAKASATAKSSSTEEIGGLSASQAEQAAGSYGLTATTGGGEGSGTSSSSTTSTSTPPTKHAAQPSKAPTVAAKTPTAAEAAAKSMITDAYRPVVFKTATKAKPNAALVEAAYRQGGIVARPATVAGTTRPATANKKKKTKGAKPATSMAVNKASPVPPATVHPQSAAKQAPGQRLAAQTAWIQAPLMNSVLQLASSGNKRKQAGASPTTKPKKPIKTPAASKGTDSQVVVPIPVPPFKIPGDQFPDPFHLIKKAGPKISKAVSTAVAKSYDTAGDIQTAISQRDLVQRAQNPDVSVRPSGSQLRSNIRPRSLRPPDEIWGDGGGDASGATDGGDLGGDLGGAAGQGGGGGHEAEE